VNHSYSPTSWSPTTSSCSFDTSSTTVCRFFLSHGGCRFGEHCSFLHQSPTVVEPDTPLHNSPPVLAQALPPVSCTGSSATATAARCSLCTCDTSAVTGQCLYRYVAETYSTATATAQQCRGRRKQAKLASSFSAPRVPASTLVGVLLNVEYSQLHRAFGACDIGVQDLLQTSHIVSRALPSATRDASNKRVAIKIAALDGRSALCNLALAEQALQHGMSWTVLFSNATNKPDCCYYSALAIVPLLPERFDQPDTVGFVGSDRLRALDSVVHWQIFASVEHSLCQLRWLELQLGLMTISVSSDTGLMLYQPYIAGARIPAALEQRIARAHQCHWLLPNNNNYPRARRPTSLFDDDDVDADDDNGGSSSSDGDRAARRIRQQLAKLTRNGHELHLAPLSNQERAASLLLATSVLNDSTEELALAVNSITDGDDQALFDFQCSDDDDDDDDDDGSDDDDETPLMWACGQHTPSRFVYPYNDFMIIVPDNHDATIGGFLSRRVEPAAVGLVRSNDNGVLQTTAATTIDVLVCGFKALSTSTQLHLSDGATRMMQMQGAGCNEASQLSEALSYEYLHRLYGASELRCETEIQYCKAHGFSMIDYRCTINGSVLGVSVTRAIDGIFDGKQCFTRHDAQRLLVKKLRGIKSAREAVLDASQWQRSVLHVWASSARACRLIEQETRAFIEQLSACSPSASDVAAPRRNKQLAPYNCQELLQFFRDNSLVIVIARTWFDCSTSVAYLYSNF
jgi:hypothetical protein